jgi:hypothetical protein
MTAVAVPITTALVTRINRREAEIRAAGKTMLLLAKAQGEDLLRLKDQTPHGGWEARVKYELTMSTQNAWKYMRVAEIAQSLPAERFAVIISSVTSINELIALFAEEQPAKRKARPTFTREDAEYALKINALAERGATEGERDAAATKLNNLAQQFGRTSDQLVSEAEKLCPDQQQSSHMSLAKDKVLARFRVMSKADLLEVIWLMLSERAQKTT